MERGEFPRSKSHRFVCGLPFQSNECWKLRRIDPSYVLCYKCCLYESMHRAEDMKETRTTLRAVTEPSDSSHSLFRRSNSKTMPERKPVLPYYLHPIRPLSAVPVETIRISFNKFIPKPLQSLYSSTTKSHLISHAATARTEIETARTSSRPLTPLIRNTSPRLNSERPRSAKPPSLDQINM